VVDKKTCPVENDRSSYQELGYQQSVFVFDSAATGEGKRKKCPTSNKEGRKVAYKKKWLFR